MSIPTAPGAEAALDEEQRRRDLVRMKAFAAGLLGLATVVFVVTRSLEARSTWLGPIRATAEAAMVGALADWFAVTALFRHPLGIPIPHTAIIQRRKDDIGRGLGTFVQQNFLTAEIIEERLAGARVASRLGAWLAEPANAARVGDQAATIVRSTVTTLRDDEIQDSIEAAVATRVRATPVAPIAARLIDLAVADGRHQELLSVILRRVAEAVEENRDVLRARLDTESPWWVPDAANDRVFDRLQSGLQRFLLDVASDPDHELRAHVDAKVRELAARLEESPEMQVRVEDLKEELLAHPALRDWSGSVWTDLKASLVRRAADPESDLRRRIEATVVSFGERLRDDEGLQAKVDTWIASTAVEVVDRSKGEAGDLIAATVARWDSADATRRIELQIGRDLQFIRINGTVVGGLAGLVIYGVGQVIG